jgi:chitin disaccharide deacetylase
MSTASNTALTQHSARATRRLIVNADDFGASPGVNRGIFEAHEHGIVTSASLMVRGPAAAEAARFAYDRPELAVGLHVELRQWRARRLPWARPRSERELQTVTARDVFDQLEAFRRLVGCDPTHLDSHHHRHRIASLRPVFLEVAQDLGIPLRHFSPTVRFCGEFYGHDGRGRPQPEAVTVDALIRLFERLGDGTTELGTHPGYPEGLKTHYREERAQEIRALRDDRVRPALERLNITLISFRDVMPASGSRP